MKVKVKVLLIFAIVMSAFSASAQDWEFIKEKQGIKIYTCKEGNNSLKSFKGEAVFDCSFDTLASKLGTPASFEWWDKSVQNVELLEHVPNEYMVYYLMYPLPWPLQNRDLCAKAVVKIDTVAKTKSVNALPLPEKVDKKKNIIRITNFRQKWEIKQREDGKLDVLLEGFIDPAGSVPSWLYNMVITDTPLRMMGSLRTIVEGKK